jgi:predicted nucleic acid-binding protein
MPLIVSDAGPLIALSRIDRLELLHKLFGKVMVPKTVVRELRLAEKRPGVLPLVQALRKDKWIKAMVPRGNLAVPGLDEGESAAILLAAAQECPLLVDERRARIVARKRGLSVLGTGRVLLAAREKGLIASVGDTLDALRESGYRLSDELCARLRELAGEV